MAHWKGRGGGPFRPLAERGRRPSGEQLVEPAHLAIIETFSFVQERTRLLEEPLSSRTPEVFLERFIAGRRIDLFPTTSAKRDRVMVCFDLPDAHCRPFISHPDCFLEKDKAINVPLRTTAGILEASRYKTLPLSYYLGDPAGSYLNQRAGGSGKVETACMGTGENLARVMCGLSIDRTYQIVSTWPDFPLVSARRTRLTG